MHEGSIAIRIPTEIKEIEPLNRLVRQFGELLEVPSRAIYAVNLALDELVTNIAMHGAGEGSQVEVRLELIGRELRSEIRDSGAAFNPLDIPPPDLDAPLSERQLGGLGIHLVRNLMDKVEYQHTDGKNVLTLLHRIR